MARKAISEYRAKKIVSDYLSIPFDSYQFNDQNVPDLPQQKSWVLKVDQGVKKRGKQGLVKLRVPSDQINKNLQDLKTSGYSQFIAEPFIEHQQTDEKYLVIERIRNGFRVLYSAFGGMEIESHHDKIQESIVNNSRDTQLNKVSTELNLPNDFLVKLIEVFDKAYFSFLEINPLVVSNNQVYLLDLAVEVDTEAGFFAKDYWQESDIIQTKQVLSRQEQKVATLAAESQASFSLNLINPDGEIFVLLSGGGASLVIADEIYNLGFADKLANYGEYSGNPSTEDTRDYAREVLSLLISSKADKKALLIGGGVANFTDVKKTFIGVVQAIEEVKDQLQNIKVFVRRGGPNQQQGLEFLRQSLEDFGIDAEIYDSKLPLTQIVNKTIEYLK